MASPAAVLNLAVIANTAPANVALAGTQARLRATAMTSNRTGATMKKAFAGVALAAGAAGVALFKIGEEFDDAYDKIRTRTGATGREMVKLKRSFRDVVSDVPATFEDASTAVGDLNTRLGLTGKPLQRMSKQMTELSRITETDVSTNIEAVSKAFVDWEVKTKDQSKTLDGFFRLSQKSGMAVSDIAENVQKFGSPLRQLGFSLDEAAAMFANFERAGVNTQTMVPGLKLAISNLTRPTETLAVSMKKLGIEAGKPDVALRQVFDLLSDKSISQITRTGLAMDVFGKRAGADMAEAIKQGRFELDEFLKIMRNGEGTIRGTGRETMDLAEHWQQFTNLLKVRLEPIAKDVFKGLSNLMKEVSAAFKQGGLGGVLDLLIAKLNEAMPKILAFGGKIASGIVKGLLNSGVWGSVAVGALLFKILGGIAAPAAAVGTSIATRLGAGIKAGLARAGIAAGVVAGLQAVFTSGGIADTIAGRRSGEIMGEKFGKAWAEAAAPMFERLKMHGAFERLGEFSSAIRDLINQMKDAGLEIPEELQKIAGATRRQAERMREQFDKTSADVRSFANTWGLSLNEIKQRTERNMQDIANSLGKNSKRGRQAISDNFLAAVQAIKNSMQTGEITAKRGAEAIHRVLLKQLKSYGIKDAEGFLSRAENVQQHGGGGTMGLQRGGAAMVPGTGSGDKVPAMLEPGEVVINRKAVAALGGTQKANRINQMIPRFGTGGIVSAPGFPGEQINSAVIPAFTSLVKRFNLFLTDAYGPGHESLEHTKYGTAVDVVPGPGGSWADVTRAVAYSVRKGFNPVYYDGSGGSVNLPPHGPGHHAHITLLTAAELLSGQKAGAFGGAGMVNLKLPRFSSDFPLGGLVATGLNNSAAAVERVIGKRAAMAGGVEGAETGGSALNKGQLSSLWTSANRAQGDPGLMAAIALAESAGKPGAIGNDPGGTTGLGLWQITTGFNDDLIAKYGGRNAMLTPFPNAQAAGDILARQGLGAWVVYTSGAYQQFMKEGGIVQKLAKGGGARRRGKPELDVGEAKSPFKAEFGQATAELPAGLAQKINQLRSLVADLEEQIATAEILHAFASSAAGSDLSWDERGGQIALNDQLLAGLQELAGKLDKGISKLPRRSPLRRDLLEELAIIQGPPYSQSKILSVRQKLDDLRNPGSDTGPTDAEILAEMKVPLLQQQLEEAWAKNFLLRAQMPTFQRVFGNMPQFADGGVVPGPIGAPVPAVVHGGETITPPGAAPHIENHIYVDPVSLDARIETYVNGQKRRADRMKIVPGAKTG